MKTIKELNESNVPIVILDKSLDELNDVVLFPEKVEKARETIARIGLPKQEKTTTTPANCENANGKDTAQHKQS